MKNSSKKSEKRTNSSKPSKSSLVETPSRKVKKNLNSHQSSSNKKNKVQSNSNGKVSQQGIVDDVLRVGSTALDVLSTAEEIATNPLDIRNYTEALPNSIMSVVKTVNHLTSSGQPQQKVVLNGSIDSKKKEQLVESFAKTAPVIRTDSVPVSYSSTFTKPDSSIFVGGKNGQFTTYVMKNTAYVSDVSFPVNNSPESITSDYRTSLFAFGNFGTRMNNFVKLYDRFRIKSLTYSYIPACSTTTPGSFHMCYRRSPKDMTTAGIIPISQATQLERYSEGSVYKSQDLTIPCETDYLYTGDVSSSDAKWYSNGFVMFGTSGGDTALDPNKLGALYCTAVLECYGQIDPNNFPALLSGPALTKVLGMSLYQQIGQFKNDDLRNVFAWSRYLVKQSVRRMKKFYEQPFDSTSGLRTFKLSNLKTLSEIKKLDSNSLIEVVSDRRLVSKGRKLRSTSFAIDIIDDYKYKKTLNTVLKSVYVECKSILDEKIDPNYKRARMIILSFLETLLREDMIADTFVPWVNTLLNYLPRRFQKQIQLTTGPTSVFDYLVIIFDDLDSLYSVDRELEFTQENEISLEIDENLTLVSNTSIEFSDNEDEDGLINPIDLSDYEIIDKEEDSKCFGEEMKIITFYDLWSRHPHDPSDALRLPLPLEIWTGQDHEWSFYLRHRSRLELHDFVKERHGLNSEHTERFIDLMKLITIPSMTYGIIDEILYVHPESNEDFSNSIKKILLIIKNSQ